MKKTDRSINSGAGHLAALIGVILLVTSWTSPSDILPGIGVPYDMNSPAAVFDLPDRLSEISGLSMADSTHVVAVQDEKAWYYIIRISDGRIEGRVNMGRDGDYEGVELVGDVLYLLRSDGDIYAIRNWRDKKPDRKHINTRLSSRYDAEGLTYDSANDRLLVLCKEYPGEGIVNGRAVYSFNPETNKIRKDPEFVISKDSVEAVSDQRRRWFSSFKPAAIAIHPITDHMYFVSSKDRQMLVMDRKGRILSVQTLTHPRIRQPEGLAFMANGDMLLATEAAGGKAALLRFSYQPF